MDARATAETRKIGISRVSIHTVVRGFGCLSF